MTDEEFEKMLERGYMTDEEFEKMQRDGEEAWDEWKASCAKERDIREQVDFESDGEWEWEQELERQMA